MWAWSFLKLGHFWPKGSQHSFLIYMPLQANLHCCRQYAHSPQAASVSKQGPHTMTSQGQAGIWVHLSLVTLTGHQSKHPQEPLKWNKHHEVPMKIRKGCWVLWNYSYGWLIATVWVLWFEPRSLQDQTVLLTPELSLQPTWFKLSWTFIPRKNRHTDAGHLKN